MLTPVRIRPATEADLPRIVELIHRGAAPGVTSGEDPGPPLPDSYRRAFVDIKRNDHCEVFVAELDGRVVGTYQLQFLPNLSNRGRWLAQIESVHVDENLRGQGIGEQMLRRAVDDARARGCFRLQLTSNKSRGDAHRFYERLGFVKSHEGMKLAL